MAERERAESIRLQADIARVIVQLATGGDGEAALQPEQRLGAAAEILAALQAPEAAVDQAGGGEVLRMAADVAEIGQAAVELAVEGQALGRGGAAQAGEQAGGEGARGGERHGDAGDRAHVGRPISRARRPAWPARGRVGCHGGSTGLRAPIGPIFTTKGGLAYVARARGRRERSQWRDRAGFAPASAIRRSFMGIRLVLCCCSVLLFRVDSARLAAAKRGQHNGGRRGNQGAAAGASGRTTARRAGAWRRARVVRESRAQPNQRWLRAQRSNSPGHEAGSLSGVPSAQPWPPVW